MTEDWIVYAFGKDTLTPYVPRPEIVRNITLRNNSLKLGTIGYEVLDFIRIGLGLPSLEDID